MRATLTTGSGPKRAVACDDTTLASETAVDVRRQLTLHGEMAGRVLPEMPYRPRIVV